MALAAEAEVGDYRQRLRQVERAEAPRVSLESEARAQAERQEGSRQPDPGGW